MPEITLEHVAQAAKWAAQAKDAALPIDGLTRQYHQDNWDCGTSCCVWGAASILSGNGPAASGPSNEWASQSLIHAAAAGLMRSGTATPEMIDNILREANLSGADLRRANLREANLRGAVVSVGNVCRKVQ